MNKIEAKYINELHVAGIWRQDLLSVIFNLRPCFRLEINDKNLTFLKRRLSGLNLKMTTYIYPPAQKLTAIIGKNKLILDQAKNIDLSFSGYHRIFKMGKILGYPECCINEFIKEFIARQNLPLFSLKNCIRKDKLDFKLNYLYSFETRVLAHPSTELNKLNRLDYLGWNKYLIPHIPCSFECRTSKKYAQKPFSIIKKYSPNYVQELKFYLKNPILFINDYEFIIFKGRVNNNSIIYKKIINPNNLTKKPFLNMVNRGNQIVINNGNIQVFKNNVLLKTFKKGAILFNFK